MNEFEATTLVELLRWRASRQPDRRAFTFLLDGEADELHLSYGELDAQARAIAARLAGVAAPGDRALLLYPPGLQYAAAFFGCLYAGVTAVPVYPPRPHRVDERLLSILVDARPRVVLTTSDILPRVERLLADSSLGVGAAGIARLASDGLDADLAAAWQEPSLSPRSLAFLQYTSGSTAAPKGVMVSHGNLLHNERLIQQAFRVTPDSLVVGWLPLYHDMGLIGNLLQPLFTGCPCVLLSPLDFLQRPLRWLRAISRYRGTISGGPNFAFDLCVRKIAPADRQGLDLSCWDVAFNGAEPVRPETLDRFVAAYAPHGFRREALLPCYGLAEATLFVAGAGGKGGLVAADVAAADLEQHRVVAVEAAAASAPGAAADPAVRHLISSGRVGAADAAPGVRQTVVIVEPESCRPAAANEVGEVWVAGPSVAEGYWNRPELSASVFRATIVAATADGAAASNAAAAPDAATAPAAAAAPDERHFLRTGDLGFLANGELFITGRAKDLIIIRGRNHYPQDVEATIERSHPALRPGCGVAFSIEAAGEERLVVVQELQREHLSDDSAPIIEAIRVAVAEQHEVQVFGVALIRTATLPKTSSGKVQRRAGRDAYLAGELTVVAGWTAALARDTTGATALGDAIAQANEAAATRQAGAASPWISGGASSAIAPSSPSSASAPTAAAASSLSLAPSASGAAVPAPPTAPTVGPAAGTATAAATADLAAAANSSTTNAANTAAGSLSADADTEEATLAWLAGEVASRAGVPAASIDPAAPLTAYALDSLHAIELAHALESRLGVPVDMEAFFEGGSLVDLVHRHAAQRTLPLPGLAGGGFTPGAPSAHAEAPSSPPLSGVVISPLSRGQRALWFLHQLDPASAAYNVPGAVTIEGELDVPALRRACKALLGRHGVLRSTFAAPHGEPVAHQRAAAEAELAFAEVNAGRWSEEELADRLLAESQRPFDLEHGPVLRVHLFTRSKQEHVLLMVVHHIATDFWSQALLLADLDVLYPAARADRLTDADPADEWPEWSLRLAALPPAPSYADFTRWQEEMLAGEAGQRLRTYWQTQLAGELPQLDLPTDRARPPVQTYGGDTVSVAVPAELTAHIKALARQGGATLFMTLLAAFDALLHRYTTQRDLLVGVPNAGRGRAGLAAAVGYFVNPLVLRADLRGDPTFSSLLAQTRRTALDAFEHADYPFPTLVEELQPQRDPSRSPLFQAMFVLQRAPDLKGQDLTSFALGEPGARLEVGGLPLVSYPLPERIAQFDLTLSVGEVGGGLKAAFNFNTDLFDAATVERMAEHFRTLLAGIAADPEQRIGDLPLLGEAERHRLLHGWNHTRAYFPTAARIHDLFVDQARETPDIPAVIFEDGEVSYQQVAERAEELAGRLTALGVGPEVLVGICAERSVELVVGILGVLLAGGAYLPLDPEYPRERLAFMLRDSGAGLLLTQQALLPMASAAAPDLPVLCLDTAAPSAPLAPSASSASSALPAAPALPGASATRAARRQAAPENVACVIYTSGSTGQPKGVALTHRNLVNLVVSFIRSYSPDSEDRILPLTSIASASFVGEIFPLLCSAGCLVLPTREQTLDTARLLELIVRRGVSILSTVPSLIAALNALKDELPKLRLILSGGEALVAADVDRILESAAIVNGYGLTETTICSTYYPVSLADLQQRGSLPIGRPLMNHQVYILDYQGGLLPIGGHGKLYIAGEGLARGYWNNPRLTADRFLPNPFHPGERMYTTGDLARWLPDGNIEFLGRVDSQVKVRGYRIELGEIEAALGNHPAVAQAAVVARHDRPGGSLVAYYVARDGQPAPGASDLLAQLRETLPDYMVPSAFVPLAALPLNPNGKLDVRALPAPEALRPDLAAAFAAPQSELERIIATIWQEALRLDKVGIHDNFFDLGGHSLLLAQVHASLRETLGRELSLVDLFKNPTVHSLAVALSATPAAPPRAPRKAAAGTATGMGSSSLTASELLAAHDAAGAASAAGVAGAAGAAGRGGALSPSGRAARDASEAASGAGVDADPREPGEPIAIIGMGGRFPGATTIDALWTNVRGGVEGIRFFTDEELLAAGVDPDLVSRPDYIKAKGVVGDIEWFDANLFGISPREAELMDPQHRIFLECAWEALERAGYNSGAPSGRVGVFAGASMNTYLITNILPDLELVASADTLQASLGNDKDPLTSRVSYKLNLKGPSITVQSASSTGLVSIHVACQSLLNDDCDMALAGGVSLHVPEIAGYMYQEGGTTSPDGHCRAFDARARGFVAGGGCGVVVLKRLREALADGDHIHAVIRGSACNNDGSLKVSYTAPSVDGQVDVYTAAYQNSGVTPDTLTYVECHGTATPMGDPIEIAALTQAFRAYTDRKGFCAIGSLKTNIGHLDSAAGACGLIKAALSLEHREIPPSLHFERPNPQIDFANSPFFVNATLRPWETDGMPRRAGVTSLGMGGTNAHVILEEAPLAPAAGPSRPWQLLLLSAHTAPALEHATTNLASFLVERPLLDLADVAFTLQVGRRRFGHRRALLCHGREDAIAALGSLDPTRVLQVQQDPGDRPVVFLFTGQGAQYPGMGRGLYESEPAFRHALDQCAELLRPSLGADLRELLCVVGPPERADSEEAAARLRQTAIAQPALFAVEYAMAQVWMEWGVRPQAMLGHSIGEYVAACLAGVFSLRDALDLVAARGRLMQQLPAGAMLAVPLSEAEVLELPELAAGGELSVAALNRPDLTVVAGPAPAVAALGERLAANGHTCRPLHTSHAFHSSMMDPILPHFAERVRRVRLSPPRLPYISNLTGTWIRPEEATDANYWSEHVRRPVRFAAGLAELLAEPSRVLLEVGPGNSLTTLARQHPARRPTQAVLPSIRHPREREDDLGFLLGTVARLWMAGVDIDWKGFYAQERRRRVPAPTYPFERQRYWVDPSKEGAAASRAGKGGKLRRSKQPADWLFVPSWHRQAMLTAPAELGEAAGPVLIFADAGGLGAVLGERLTAAGREVYSVAPGPVFARLGERSFTLDPAHADGYELLLADLARQGRPPAAILHLWAVDPLPESTAADLDRTLDATFHSLVRIAQALGRHSLTERIALLVVSSGLQRVVGDEPIAAAKAALLGPCRVIPREYPNLSCRSLDLAPAPATASGGNGGSGGQGDQGVAAGEAGAAWSPAVVSGVLAELASLAGGAVTGANGSHASNGSNGSHAAGGPGGAADIADGEEAVALRGGYRWTEAFDRLPASATAAADPATGAPAALRRHGVYLVTGGLGGLGLEVASYLARAVAARLVLVATTPMPDRADWQDWLAAHDEGNAVSRRIRQIEQLEAAGAEVLVAAADVTDAAAMAAVRDEALERFGAIHGVFHAAGRPGGGILQLKTRAASAAVLDPKLRGTLVLEEVMAGLRLDFLVLFSSITAVLAQPGQADYTAANAFLDAWAEARSAGGTPTLALDWDAWREVGMAVTTEVPAELKAWRREELEKGLSSAEGVEVLRRALTLLPVAGERAGGSFPARLLVSTLDFEERLRRDRLAVGNPAALAGAAGAGVPGTAAAAGGGGGRTAHPRPALANPYVPPRDEGERRVAGVWQELLGIDPVGVHDNFFDLGGNSLMAIRVISRLKSDMGVDVSEVSIFEGPTVASLAKLLAPPEAEQEPAFQDSRSRGERRLARRGRRGAATLADVADGADGVTPEED